MLPFLPLVFRVAILTDLLFLNAFYLKIHAPECSAYGQRRVLDPLELSQG